MPDAINLLPSNQTPFERSHEDTDAARLQLVDAEEVIAVKDAMLCDARFLPLLGWERNVDLWYPDWGEEKKRHVAHNWYRYERLKGTPLGFKRFYSLVNVKLRAITSPPQGAYARAAWTDAQRLAWLNQFQQIRIYPYVPVTEFARGFFASSIARSLAYVGHVAPTAYRVTIDTVSREARLYEPRTNIETVLTRREMVREVAHVGSVYDFEDIVLPEKRLGFYVGDFVGTHKGGEHYVGEDNAPDRVIRTEIARPYNVAVTHPQWTSHVPDARRLVTIKPDLVRNRFLDSGFFLGHSSTGLRSEVYPKRDVAWQHIYEKFYLFDINRDYAVGAGQPGSYLGHARLGMTPYTAEMKVEIRGKRHSYEFAEYPGKFLTPEYREPLDRALDATRACKAARDTIFLDTTTRRPRQFGDWMRFGDAIELGSKVEA